jgi:hypothetical protein
MERLETPGTPTSRAESDGVTAVFTPSSRRLRPQQGSHQRVRSIGEWVKGAFSPSTSKHTDAAAEALTPQKVAVFVGFFVVFFLF